MAMERVRVSRLPQITSVDTGNNTFTPKPSWPDLFRPSTWSIHAQRSLGPPDVDARNTCGHDDT